MFFPLQSLLHSWLPLHPLTCHDALSASYISLSLPSANSAVLFARLLLCSAFSPSPLRLFLASPPILSPPLLHSGTVGKRGKRRLPTGGGGSDANQGSTGGMRPHTKCLTAFNVDPMRGRGEAGRDGGAGGGLRVRSGLGGEAGLRVRSGLEGGAGLSGRINLGKIRNRDHGEAVRQRGKVVETITNRGGKAEAKRIFQCNRHAHQSRGNTVQTARGREGSASLARA
eukprot:342472-Hanusia_phi.AAC.2